MAKPEDRNKLDQCLDILDSTDLGLSLVWLWTWSTIKNILEDDEWERLVTDEQAWEHLCEAVVHGHEFSLEFGAEQHYEEVFDWMVSRDLIGRFDEQELDD